MEKSLFGLTRGLLFFAAIPVLCLMIIATAPVPAGADAVSDIDAGLAAYKRSDFKEAFRLYNRAINSNELNPEYLALALSNRGSAYVYLGQIDKARKDFKESIRLNPNFGISYYNLGTIHLNENQPKTQSSQTPIRRCSRQRTSAGTS